MDLGLYEIMLIIWGSIIVLSIVVELSTTDFGALWFGLGGVVALIFAAIKPIPFYISIIVFVLVTTFSFIFLGKLVKKKMKPGKEALTNVESLVGKKYKLISPVTQDKPGTIKIGDVIWTCIGENQNVEIKANALVTIKKIEGNKLIVKE